MRGLTDREREYMMICASPVMTCAAQELRDEVGPQLYDRGLIVDHNNPICKNGIEVIATATGRIVIELDTMARSLTV